MLVRGSLCLVPSSLCEDSSSLLRRRQRRGSRALCRALLAAAAVLCLLPVVARASTFTVTDTSDSASDTGSLRYALSNLASGAAATTNTITITATGTITLGSNLPYITQGVTITGPGANQLTIDGANAYSIILIESGDTAVSGVTITRGRGYEFGANNYAGGGAFVYGGSGTFTNCAFIDNTSNHGGGIENYGTLTVTNSTFYNNTVTLDSSNSAFGGAVESLGTATITNSTFYQNSSLAIGGAISSQGPLTLTNDTIAGNSAPDTGGAAIIGGTATVNNSVFSNNTSQNGGASIEAAGGTVNGNSNVYYNNTTGGTEEDCSQCTTGSPGSDGNILATSNPLALPLGWYGGQTETFLPQPGSAAICAGSASLASSAGLNTDQRGFVLNAIVCVNNGVDAGAVQSAYISVETLSDATHTNCALSSDCSLRDILVGNTSSSQLDIDFDSNLTSTSNPGTITLGSALPAIAGQINILGPGANQLTVSANNDSSVGSVFNVNSGATATLYGLTITGGNSFSSGGGGIDNGGTLAVLDSAVSGNTAGDGGGIYNESGASLTIAGSTVSGNTGDVAGGGIDNGGSLTMTESTVSNNSDKDVGGGGIFLYSGALTVSDSTIAGNTDAGILSGGGGINVAGGSLTLNNSIVSGNTSDATAANILGPYTASDSVVGGTSNSTTSYPGGDTTQPLIGLSPLQYNGAGATVETMIPLPGSAVLCAGLTSLIPTALPPTSAASR